MKVLRALTLLGAVSLTLIGVGHADDKAPANKGVEGSWEGPLQVTPAVSLRITLDVAKAKDGTLSGKWGSPDQGAKDLPVDSIALEDDVLTFSAKAAGSAFKGKCNKDRTEVVGEWSQGGNSYPLTLKRFDPAKAAVMAVPKALEGIWEGKLQLNGGLELRLVLKVEKGKDGALTPTVVSPDQSPMGIPVSSIDLKDGVLTFECKVIGAKFSGKKNEKGTAFEGEFVQGGAKLPLTLKKTDKITESARPQTPKPPFSYRAEAVTYENKAGKVKLAGTLTVPSGSGPFPAVILITGSGAQDRDETILGHKPFFVLADDLTRRGLAVLRVDDRGVGGSTGSIQTSTSEDFAGDVLAGLDFLKARKDVNSKKLGLIGHSEGGIIAPMVAARSKDVAFIVLMAGTGVPGAQILEAQAQLILKANGASESELKTNHDRQKRLIDIIAGEKDDKAARPKLTAALKEIRSSLSDAEKKAGGEAAGGLSEAAINAFNNAWFRYFLTYDPRPTLRTVACPVLAINGEKDLQVPARENLAEIGKALKAGGNTKVKTVALPGLNHLFQPCKTGSPSEYASIETTIAPEALKTMGDWIVEQTHTN